ncbi:hypothetical protein EDB82DRAFT_481462 [Fusarium venenatum]|uniref:uncharacterized protein n=1 Tax=Fusarium venenatum TaxID=56646 RepID=UPI001DE497FD|nr:hypothetical protein EDB82DRAFT_481462 [Fusarium venenatum]
MMLDRRRCILVLCLLLVQLTQATQPVSPAGHLGNFNSPHHAFINYSTTMYDIDKTTPNYVTARRYHLMMEQDCHLPVLDRRREINITCAVMMALAIAFFGMRVTSKIIGFVPYGHDDSLIIAALFVLAAEYMYAISLTFTKLSILAFFLRVFPDQKFRWMVHGTVVFILLMSAIYLVLFILQRVPMWTFWEGWKEKDPDGVLLNSNAIGTSHGVLNVALDVWMIILPMSQLWKIGIKPKKKLGIMSMFGVGAFLTIVSTVRIPYVTKFAKTFNVTADTVDTIIWSMVEASVGMMVACMPGTRQFARDMARRWKRNRPSDESNKGNIFIDRSLATIVMTRQQSTIATDNSFSSNFVKPDLRVGTDR